MRRELKAEGDHEEVINKNNFLMILVLLYRYLKMLFIESSICKPISKTILGDTSIDTNFTGKPVILLKKMI